MLCEQVMQGQVLTCRDNVAVGTVARAMRDRRIGFLVVVDAADRPIGVITDRDLVIRAMANESSPHLRLSEVMTRPPLLTCRPQDELIKVELAMADARKSRALVLGDDGKVVGVVTLSDIARREPSPGRTGWLLRELSHAAPAALVQQGEER